MNINTYTDSQGRIGILPVCYMQSNMKNLNMPIAIRLTIDIQSKRAFWEDTRRGHSIEVEKCQIGDNVIDITSKDGTEWKFVPLTKAIYDNIKDSLTSMPSELKNDEDVQAYYMQTNFYM